MAISKSRPCEEYNCVATTAYDITIRSQLQSVRTSSCLCLHDWWAAVNIHFHVHYIKATSSDHGRKAANQHCIYSYGCKRCRIH